MGRVFSEPMIGIFGKKVAKAIFPEPKVIKAPPVPPPLVVPDVSEDVETQARRRRPRGRRETFLTGDLVPETGKKKVLG